ncbi:hypothetical protein [Streptosporangium sp. NPDC001681]|uniref:hypothetical protein n=1 Tax=Streptosporangium sp. NPDC001681 TaxID=3154395 RepID=UPI0033321AAD
MSAGYVYRNTRTGQTVERAERSIRLDNLDVWLCLQAPAPAPEPEPPAEPAAGSAAGPARPSEHDNKAAWVAYAAARGMDESDAKALSKAALIEEFGQDDEENDDGSN